MNLYIVLATTVAGCFVWAYLVHVAQTTKVYQEHHDWLLGMLPKLHRLHYIETAHTTKAAVERSLMNLDTNPIKLVLSGVLGVTGCAVFASFITGAYGMLPMASVAPTSYNDAFGIVVLVVLLSTVFTFIQHVYVKNKFVKLLRSLYAEQMFVA